MGPDRVGYTDTSSTPTSPASSTSRAESPSSPGVPAVFGRAMAIGFAQAGASVVVTSRKLDVCQEVAADIERLGGTAIALTARMQEADEARALVHAAVDRFGRLDMVVNNAATVLDRTLEALTRR